MYMYWSTIHVQIIDGHGWLAIVTGVATGNMHLPGGMIQMKSMSRRCKVCSLFFACIIWYLPKYCLLLCRVLYHPTVARLHTRFCLRSHSADCCRGTYCSGARQLGRIRVRGWGTRYRRGRLECIFSEYHFVSNTNTIYIYSTQSLFSLCDPILPVVLHDTLQSNSRSLSVLPPKVTYDTSRGITGSQIIRYLGRIDV